VSFVLSVIVLSLIYPMLSFSLDCTFCIAPSLFSNVYYFLIVCYITLNVQHYHLHYNGEVYSIKQHVKKFTNDLRQVGGFLPPIKLTPRCNWNIVERGVKHNNTNIIPITLYTHTNKPFSPLTIEYWIPKSNLNLTTLYTHTNKPFSPLTIEYWIPKLQCRVLR
jgi:hypothetical protein